MTDAVTSLNLAPKLNQSLQLRKLRDYLLLLYWIFFFPQALKWYEQTFVPHEYRGAEGEELRRAVLHDVTLRNLIIQAMILSLFVPLVLPLAMEQAGVAIDWFGVAKGMVVGLATGVTFGVLTGVAAGVVIGIDTSVALGVALGVTVGIDAGAAIGMVIGVALGVVMSCLGYIDSDDYDGVTALLAFCAVASVVLGVIGYLALGMVELVPRVDEFLAGASEFLAGASEFLAEAYELMIGVFLFISAFTLSLGLAFGLTTFAMILRPDAWILGALYFAISGFLSSISSCTFMPLPGLQHNLKEKLQEEWSSGVKNINDLLVFSKQFIPAVKALNDSFKECPPERLLPLADEVAKIPCARSLLRFSSDSLTHGLKREAIEGAMFLPEILMDYFYNPPNDFPLDTQARAACAGFLYLHEYQSSSAAKAFSVVRSLPNGKEMYCLSQALSQAYSVYDFRGLADLFEEVSFRQATTRPLEAALLHSETWQALEHLQRCVQEAHTMKESVSRAAKSWALNRAIGEVLAVQNMENSLPASERFLVTFIARSWEKILVSESSNVGNISIQEPVKNPYVAGDPVVGQGFRGREDILRSLEELWCGATAPPSVVLCGHRRMGKTSILRNISSHLGSEVRLAYVNLLTLGGAPGGLSDLFLAMSDEIKAALPTLPEPEISEFDSHPYRAFEQYLEMAKAALDSSRLIIALDEFEQLEKWMCAGQIPRDLLNVLRGYMQKDEHIAFAFAGLHTLEEMTADYFNPLFASVRTIPVSFFSHDATFQVLANPPLEDFPLDYSQEALQRIWELTGGQPYLVQLVGHYLVSRFNRLTFEQGKPLEPVFSLEDVEAVIADPEFYSQGRYYFAGIWGQAGQGAEGQQELLKFIAAFTDGISIEGIAARFGPNSENTASALKELERHDVLREKDGQWQFTVELMRRWVKEFR